MRLSRKIGQAQIPILVIPLLLIFLFAVVNRYRTTLSNYRDILSRTTENIAREYDIRRTAAEANLRLIGESYLTERFLETTDEALRYRVFFPTLSDMILEYHAVFPEYREIRLILPDGFEDLRTTSRPIFNNDEFATDEPWFGAGYQDGDQLHSELIHHEDLDEYVILFVLPLRYKSSIDGRSSLVMAMGLDFLVELIRDTRIGKDGLLYVTDETSQILFGSGEETDFLPPFSDLASRYEIQTIQLDRGLVLHSMWPRREALIDTWPIALLMFVGSLFVFFLLWISLQSLMRRLVLTPLNVLEETSARYARSDFSNLPDKYSDDELGQLMSTFSDLGRSLKKAEEDMKHLAYRDGLTGLANRVLFQIELNKELARARRRSTMVGLLFLDLDGFKDINDTRGHDVGDLLLKGVARRISECLREEDHLASMRNEEVLSELENPDDTKDIGAAISRLGGDEFTVLLSDIHGEKDTVIVANRILNALASPFDLSGQTHNITGSIGIALYPLHGENPVQLLKNADTAMYQAKNQGKNDYKIYQSLYSESTDRFYRIKSSLDTALFRNQFTLYYQPLVNMETGGLVGCEALIRWDHPELGRVSPAEFIPISEKTGHIRDIGRWVIWESFRFFKRCGEKGIPPFKLSVNVSGKQLNDPEFIDLVERALRDVEIDPRHIQLEITETAIMGSFEIIRKTLAKLKELGFLLAMDDFGVGQSSLERILKLPLDNIKIDRSFIDKLEGDAAKGIISGVLGIAEKLNLLATAEGVETEFQRDRLRSLGCPWGQGYLFSHPLPGDDFLDYCMKEFPELH